MRTKVVLYVIFSMIVLYYLYPKPMKEEAIYLEHAVPNAFEVDLEGEIIYPGVYKFYEAITVEDVIIIAGGFTKQADIESVSLKMVLEKSVKIKVLKINETEKEQEKININEASFKMLLEIPYITENRAASILLYRQQNGKFRTIDELIHVKYIGQATLEKIRPYISVN